MPRCSNATRQIVVDKRAFSPAYSPFLDRSTLCDQRAVMQMADDFRIFAAAAGAMSQDDMEILGWTPAQIAAYAARARRHANRRAQG